MDWETLNDYADGQLSAAAGDEVARHVDACDECHAALTRLRHVLAAAKSSADSVEAPPEAWQGIRAEIELRKVVPLTKQGTTKRIPWLRVAAVVAIIAASAATTVVIMTANKQRAVVAASGDSTTPGVLPVSVVTIDREYVETIRTLTTALDANRAKLAPETVDAVQRSLKVIDDAIAEARDALLRDPGSAHLRGMLSKNYRQKVDLLRRISARVTST